MSHKEEMEKTKDNEILILDERFIDKVSARLSFSNYIYCPLRRSFSTFSNILTVVSTAYTMAKQNRVKKCITKGSKELNKHLGQHNKTHQTQQCIDYGKRKPGRGMDTIWL